jgi:cytochrome c oxidase assembly protein subunit 15
VTSVEHRWALVTALATFALLTIGGTVNPTGSSLACPEAFIVCHGQLFPEMTGGVLFEHGHRQVAMLVGLLQLGLTALLWVRRPALRILAVTALAMVAVQALLGALTVYFKLPWIVSTGHLMVAMGYFASVLLQAWMTRPAPRAEAGPTGVSPDAEVTGSPQTDHWGGAGRAADGRLRWWVALGGGAVLLQILLGGLMRHHGGALASLDLPLHEGSLWPAGAALPLQLHMAHRLGGVVAGLVAVAAAIAVWRGAGPRRGLRRAALAVPLVVLGQISLGLLVVATYRSVPVVVAHFAGGALLWALFCGMFLVTWGGQPAPRTARGEALVAGGGAAA